MSHEPVVTADLHERLMRYEEMRLAGVNPTDAVLELGMDTEASGRYERWYRKRHNLQPRSRWSGDGNTAGPKRHVPRRENLIGGVSMWAD